MLFAPKRYAEWEVVDSKSVDPVPMYYDDFEDDELELLTISKNEITASYTFDMTGDTFPCRQVLSFARQQLLKDLAKQNYNLLLQEGWTLTMMRRGKARRVQILYQARPARTKGIPRQRPPPFMEVLDR